MHSCMSILVAKFLHHKNIEYSIFFYLIEVRSTSILQGYKKFISPASSYFFVPEMPNCGIETVKSIGACYQLQPVQTASPTCIILNIFSVILLPNILSIIFKPNIMFHPEARTSVLLSYILCY